MSKMKFLTTAAAIAVVASSVGVASANPGASPYPDPGAPSCSGLVVAISNESSGGSGASGNATASAGPGYFLGPVSADAIALVRNGYC
jgi:uncharacterized membrane protein